MMFPSCDSGGEDWLALVVHGRILNITHNFLTANVSSPPISVMFDYITSYAVDPMTGDIFFSDGEYFVHYSTISFMINILVFLS